jgi:hypothetical protein
MSLPGFTAEAALYRMGGGYRTAGAAGQVNAGMTKVVPQLPLPSGPCIDTCVGLYKRCIRFCNRAMGADDNVCQSTCDAGWEICSGSCQFFGVV